MKCVNLLIRFLWKVGYSEVEDAAITVVQINNPWELNRDDYLLCHDICDELDWFKVTKRFSVQHGYTYCCDVNALRKQVKTIPEFTYSKILKTVGNSEFNFEEISEEVDVIF